MLNRQNNLGEESVAKAKALVLAVAFALAPVAPHAQEIDVFPGFYIGAGGGITTPLSSPNNATGIGWVVGGKFGYDFVGPRIDVDVGYGQTPTNLNIPGTALTNKAGQLTALANLSYDFMPRAVITPYNRAPPAIAYDTRRTRNNAASRELAFPVNPKALGLVQLALTVF